MLKEETRKGISEVLFILNYTAKSDVDRIPEKFITFLNKNASTEYTPNLVLKKNLNDMDLLPETKNILALIYRDYWCNAEEKIAFEQVLNANDKRRLESESDKYNLTKILGKEDAFKGDKVMTELPVVVEKDGFWKRVFRFFRGW